MEEKKKHPGSENLIPLNTRTKEEQRKIAIMGGKASGEARREQKRLSDGYAEIIAELNGIDLEEGKSLKDVVKGILYKRNAASVAMLKAMHDATEGQKTTLCNGEGSDFQIVFNPVKPDNAN